MAGDGVEELRRLVLADPDLQAQLLAIPERAPFVAAAVDLARTHGLAVMARDIDAAMTAAHRRLRGQWV